MSKNMESTQWELLQLLKSRAGEVIPGPELAERLGLSRTGIWKHVRNLKARGYEIESHPREGYRLTGVPDLLLPEEIVPLLETSWLGREYHHFPRIGSTNDQALQLAVQGASHGCTVVAEEQTAGRGRLRRTWVSPPGCGIYASMLLLDPIPVREAPQCVLVAGLALVKALSSRYGISATLKWPNDVLVRGRKVAGILAEMQSDQEVVRFLVVGVGLNVNHEPRDLEGPLRYPATSLAMELGDRVSRRDALPALLLHLEQQYERFRRRGLGAMLPELEEASCVLGKDVKILRGDEEISGRAVRLTPEGGLKILDKNGDEKTVWAGDITRVEGPDFSGDAYSK